ncbi:MAG: hypothetical protein FMNOHCHN_01607 [Ignavibacteriaceae bacterium]|nr:hypothetical protein [Ignavibacteriaceae bacterium]
MAKSFNSEKPIVFLDIDGVLNSTDFAINRKTKTKHRHIDQIDERAVGFLNEISDWNFVLSSSWRRFISLDEMNEILKTKGFNGQILDKTPVLEHPNLRGNEIYSWVHSHIVNGSDFDNYVIFDDDSDFLLWQKDNFIHVDGHFGIGPNHIYRAKRVVAIAKPYTFVDA